MSYKNTVQQSAVQEMQANGEYKSFAWPGGYPLYYVVADGEILCPTCANDNIELTEDATDKQWFVISGNINWEDDCLYCDNCNKNIESAYGKPTPNPFHGVRTCSTYLSAIR